MKLTTHLRLVPRLRMSGAVPLLPVYGLHGVDKDKCAFMMKETIPREKNGQTSCVTD